MIEAGQKMTTRDMLVLWYRKFRNSSGIISYSTQKIVTLLLHKQFTN